MRGMGKGMREFTDARNKVEIEPETEKKEKAVIQP
jgi:Sec-independent protein translocase protein TatA